MPLNGPRAIPPDIIGLYRGLSRKESFYIKMRWAISPIRDIERQLPLKGRIYDIGCGAGLLSNTAAAYSRDRDVTGIDLSEEKIRVADKSLAGRSNINFKTADALKYEFTDAAAVTMCDALHHIAADDQESLIRRAYGSLRSGGVLIIQEIDKKPFYKYIFARSVDMLLNMGSPVYYRSREEWEGLLTAIGFTVKVDRIDKGYPIAAIMMTCVKNNDRG